MLDAMREGSTLSDTTLQGLHKTLDMRSKTQRAFKQPRISEARGREATDRNSGAVDNVSFPEERVYSKGSENLVAEMEGTQGVDDASAASPADLEPPAEALNRDENSAEDIKADMQASGDGQEHFSSVGMNARGQRVSAVSDRRMHLDGLGATTPASSPPFGGLSSSNRRNQVRRKPLSSTHSPPPSLHDLEPLHLALHTSIACVQLRSAI